MNNKLIRIIFCLVLLLGSLSLNVLYGRCDNVVSIKSVKRFYTALAKRNRPYTVAVLYDCCENSRDKDALLRMIKLVSNYALYKKGDVQFLTIDIRRECLDDLMRDFHVSQLPAILLFKDGTPIMDENNGIATLTGYVDSDQLHNFIDDYLREELQERVEWKNEERLIRAQEAAYYWNTYPWWWNGCWTGCYNPYPCGVGCGFYGGCGARGRCGGAYWSVGGCW